MDENEVREQGRHDRRMAREQAEREELELLKLWQSLAFKMIAAVREAYPPGAILDTDGPDAIRRLRERAEKAEACARPEALRNPQDIIGNIVADICSRKGLSHEWEAIDDSIRDEIVAEWLTFFAPSPLAEKRGG